MYKNDTAQKIGKHMFSVYNIIDGSIFRQLEYHYQIVDNNDKWVVDCFKCTAIDALIEEYSHDENYKCRDDHLKAKYDKKWFEHVFNPMKYKEKGPKVWCEYIKRWDCVQNDISKAITDEKTGERIGKVHLLYEFEPDLTEKKEKRRSSAQRWEYKKEIMQMWLKLYNKTKEDIRPIVTLMDFSWNKDFVTALISDSQK